MPKNESKRAGVNSRLKGYSMDDLKNSLGFRYLQETKFDAQTLWHKPRLDITPAQPYKQYAEAEKIKLPTDWEMDKSLHETLQY